MYVNPHWPIVAKSDTEVEGRAARRDSHGLGVAEEQIALGVTVPARVKSFSLVNADKDGKIVPVKKLLLKNNRCK